MNIALILSGGIGSRLGADIPKQYMKVNNKMIISYCMKTLTNHPDIDGIQIVADIMWQERIEEEFRQQNIFSSKFYGFSMPGESRQGSILNGLKDIKTKVSGNTYILIHDAARPLISNRLITECLRGVIGHDGLMPILPVKDTMYLTDNYGNRINQLLERERVVAGQAPEVFLFEKYYKINTEMTVDEINCVHGSTEPAYKNGLDIVLIPGEEKNFKITTKEDFERFRLIMEGK